MYRVKALAYTKLVYCLEGFGVIPANSLENHLKAFILFPKQNFVYDLQVMTLPSPTQYFVFHLYGVECNIRLPSLSGA